VRYGVLFLLFGALLAYEAISPYGWHWVLLWPALSFCLVAAAYLGLGPCLFGKREDGSLAWYSVLPLLPYFLYTWGLWHLLRLFRNEDCFNEFAPGLFVGRRAFPHELPKDVSLIVDMTCEFVEPRGVRSGRTYLCFPTLDGSVPTDESFARLVRSVVEWSGPVYIHCAEGHGRSGAAAAAVLVAKGHVSSGEEALVELQEVRPRIGLNKQQKKAVERLGRRLPL
jgi:hypothetical protein